MFYTAQEYKINCPDNKKTLTKEAYFIHTVFHFKCYIQSSSC